MRINRSKRQVYVIGRNQILIYHGLAVIKLNIIGTRPTHVYDLETIKASLAYLKAFKGVEFRYEVYKFNNYVTTMWVSLNEAGFLSLLDSLHSEEEVKIKMTYLYQSGMQSYD